MKHTLLEVMSLSLVLGLFCGGAFAQAPPHPADLDTLAAQFAGPGPEFRGKPFWSWNGELKEDELLRQIEVLKEMGMGGYFMHSRTGLATEYLGDEWFNLINRCADEGNRLGMESWLYDEDRWPSGTAGGLVTAKPEFRQKYISLQTVPAAEFSWHDDIVAAFACTLSELAYRDCQRIQSSTTVSSLQGKTILVFTVEAVQPSSFFNGNTDVDRLSREATDYFIQLTHEKYRERCGNRLGQSIRGIFTDEPHRGAVFSGFAVGNPNRARMAPWTDKLPDEFQKRFGCDLIERLPELFLKKDGQSVALVKWQYMELLQELFLENWCKPVREWCDREHMIFTGHFLHEDSLTCQAAVHGSLMRAYELQHYPGVDVLSEGNRNYWIVKQLSSAARQLGQTHLLSELYGCTGWQMNFQSHKAVGDWQALFGINLRCPHLSWYTMAGEAKRDYPASIFFQSGWWRDYHFVEDYYARLNLLLAQGRPACDVLVLNPIESVWCQVGVGWAEGLSAKTKEIEELEKAYREIFFWLAGSHIDFDYGDEEMFGRLSSIAKVGGKPVLRFGEAEYRVVVVPRMTTIRSTTLQRLEAFRKAGGRVVFAGEPPAYVDVAPSTAVSDVAKKAKRVAWNKEALADAVKDGLRVPVEIIDKNKTSQEKIFCQLRDCGDTKILVAINTDREKGASDVTLRVKAEAAVSEWNCLTGRRTATTANVRSGWTEIQADFAPCGEHAYVLTAKPLAGLSQAAKLTEVDRQVVQGPFSYTLNEPNVCVLDLANYQITDQPVVADTEILKIDRAVRNAFGLPTRSGDMVQPWFSRKFEPKPEAKGKIHIEFPFVVQSLPKGKLQLALEGRKDFSIVLNSHAVDAPVDGWWVDPAIQTVPIPTGFLILGDNRLELTADFRSDMNLEALYLLGEFGVTIDGIKKSLTHLPDQLNTGDLAAQGLPFYSGSVMLKVPIPEKPKAEQRAYFIVPKFEAACIKIGPDKIIPWQPYEVDVTEEATKTDTLDVTIVLTRRNTFGPLHQLPLRAGSCGPGNWTTEGAGWSQSYQLYPAGLLEPAFVSIRTPG